MAALLPVAAYNYWVFYRQPAFTFYTEAAYVFPTRADLAWALGPAARARRCAALGAPLHRHLPRGPRRRRPPAPRGLVRDRRRRVRAAAGPLLAAVPGRASACRSWPWPPSASAGGPSGYTIAAALALSSTAVAAVWLTLQPTLGAYAPAERFALAWALRRDCRAGDRLVAPADIGLWAGGFTRVPGLYLPRHRARPRRSAARRSACSTSRAIPPAAPRSWSASARRTSCCPRPGPPRTGSTRASASSRWRSRERADRQLAAYRIASVVHGAMTTHLRIAVAVAARPRRGHHRPLRGGGAAAAGGRGLHGDVLLPGRHVPVPLLRRAGRARRVRLREQVRSAAAASGGGERRVVVRRDPGPRSSGDSPVLGFHALRVLAIVAHDRRGGAAAGRGGDRRARGSPGRSRSSPPRAASAGCACWIGTPGIAGPRHPDGPLPFHQSLMNAHFVAATALFVWTLVLHLEWRAGRRSRWAWVACGVGARASRGPTTSSPSRSPPSCSPSCRRATRRPVAAVLELAWIAPVFGYYALLMHSQRGLGGWTGVQSGDLTPPLDRVRPARSSPPRPLAALLEAARAGGSARRPHARSRSGRRWWRSIVVGYPSPMVKQFATTLGPAVVLLAALLTPARWIAPAAAALCPTSVFLAVARLPPVPGLVRAARLRGGGAVPRRRVRPGGRGPRAHRPEPDDRGADAVPRRARPPRAHPGVAGRRRSGPAVLRSRDPAGLEMDLPRDPRRGLRRCSPRAAAPCWAGTRGPSGALALPLLEVWQIAPRPPR